MTDGWAEHQRRAEDAWRRAQRLGAVLEIGRTLQFGDEAVELLATLADATQTVVAYRAPAGSHLFPSPVDPPGGASGGAMGDVLVAHLPPAEGPTVLVNFGRFDEDDHEVELPIDRARTRPYERRSVSLPAPVTADGARVAIRAAAVGLLQATIEVDISSDDPTLVAATIGFRGFLPSPHRRAGSGPLWRDWIPTREPVDGGDATVGSSSTLRRELRASATATARFTQLPEGQRPAPSPPPPKPAEFRAVPGGQILAAQGGEVRGGPVRDNLSLATTFRFDPPADDASGLELVLDDLFIFRRCDGELVDVPGPRSGEAVDLAGRSLACGSARIELVRWEPSEDGTPRLVVRSSQPGMWPDIRVVVGDASVSLWLRPTTEDELAGGLPGMYNPAFPAGGQLTLGLRMLGRKTQIPPITIPLTPARTP